MTGKAKPRTKPLGVLTDEAAVEAMLDLLAADVRALARLDLLVEGCHRLVAREGEGLVGLGASEDLE